MALKKLIPTSPSANLKAGVDMTPLKTGDYNNKIRQAIDAEVAITTARAVQNTADIATNATSIGENKTTINTLGSTPTFTGATIKMTALPIYNDQAAAVAAGLAVGTLYQTNGLGAAPFNGPGIVLIVTL